MTAGQPFVLIMAGGTGGHIFPGLAVADSLRGQGVDVRWLGARGAMECRRVPDRGIPLDVVDIAGLRGKGAASWLLAPWKVLRAVAQAWRLLGRRRPCCAISFGGYAAGPGGIAARLRGVPLLVHEQNRVAGLTNRVLARFAARVLQAFPGTWPEERRPVTCGNPVRRDVVDLPVPEARLARREGPPRLLVTGGSQGALALNRLLPAALGLLGETTQFEVRHQAGPRWVEETVAAYRAAGMETTPGCRRPLAADDASVSRASALPQQGAAASSCRRPLAGDEASVSRASALPQQDVPQRDLPPQRPVATVQVSDFIDDMAAAYAWADLVVCRAGALTVSEVAAAGLAAVFIPFPHAVDDHQTRNAAFLVEAGAAVLLNEAGLSAEDLAGTLAGLFADPSRRLEMAERARAAAVPDSAARVASLCGAYAA